MRAIKNNLILLLLVLLSINILAAEKEAVYKEQDVPNLINGITSDNNGLMRSSVYLAGKYKVAEATGALLEVMQEESDPSNVILIALALYEIGDKDAMMKVIETANNSSNLRVKNMLTSIALKYLSESKVQYVLR